MFIISPEYIRLFNIVMLSKIIFLNIVSPLGTCPFPQINIFYPRFSLVESCYLVIYPCFSSSSLNGSLVNGTLVFINGLIYLFNRWFFFKHGSSVCVYGCTLSASVSFLLPLSSSIFSFISFSSVSVNHSYLQTLLVIKQPLFSYKKTDLYYFILPAFFSDILIILISIMNVFSSFFSIWAFFHDTLTNHRTAGKGGGYFFNSSLPLPPTSQTLRY